MLLDCASPTSQHTVSHVVRDQTYKLLFDWIKRQHYKSDSEDVIIIDMTANSDEEADYAYSDIASDGDVGDDIEEVNIDDIGTPQRGLTSSDYKINLEAPNKKRTSVTIEATDKPSPKAPIAGKKERLQVLD